MTTEEKAKRYDEALSRARMLNNGEDVDIEIDATICEYIFPELKESEDEKIRKALIELVKCNERNGYTLLNNVSTGSMISWLEKQGKQTQQTPRWMIDFLDENRVKFASVMEDYDDMRNAEGRLLAIIDWLENIK